MEGAILCRLAAIRAVATIVSATAMHDGGQAGHRDLDGGLARRLALAFAPALAAGMRRDASVELVLLLLFLLGNHLLGLGVVKRTEKAVWTC